MKGGMFLVKGNYLPARDPTDTDIDDPTGAKIRQLLIFGDNSFTVPYLKTDTNGKVVQFGGSEDLIQHIKNGRC